MTDPSPCQRHYVVQSTPFVHMPGFFKFAMDMTPSDWELSAQEVAARLYALVPLMPTMPAADLLQVAKGEVRLKWEGNDLHIIVSDDREGRNA